ncbi:1,4-alpha-glucan branching protein GlgB [Proteiniclasticum sp.]|uniref:1,4-alpha-glucan branching protein GlgB n=1 Tax=Proteiniclasticum sp. TaxID=2053595 RepID=UPI00289B7EC4|nr:1,4-alpha-glucan branching protein GlgB [Proteiniclasticum sp.]
MAKTKEDPKRVLNTEFNHYLFNTGEHIRSYEFMGAHIIEFEGKKGVQFTVWAPNAQSVFIAGDFNEWGYGEMFPQGSTGIWTAFIEGIGEDVLYKYRIRRHDGYEFMKADPFAFYSEHRPNTASIVKDLSQFKWSDGTWRAKNKRKNHNASPMNIYEVHLGSWKKHWDGGFFTFKEYISELIPYVKEMGYTHVELLPVMEHPLDDSWGYQITGYYSVTSRFGEPTELMQFINECHKQDIGVILDWVPAHFCRDAHGLYQFDGTPTYEYQDPDKATNNRWGTTHFDYGKPQVQSFLISNAIFWMDMFHADGLRVDAVSSMLYLDYDTGPWTPNIYGGNTNLEGVALLKKLNSVIREEFPSAFMIAEESTAFPLITHDIESGGLGFTHKWNMGWMNDILRYFELDPLYRKNHHNLITFSFMYVFNENYILPLSHDEVVHGKSSLLNKMPGDEQMKFQGLRTLMAYMMCHPGKKVNFMGNEIAQWMEWRFREGLEWVGLKYENHQKHQNFIKELNQIYLNYKALSEIDDSYDGIDILDADNKDESLFTFIRKGKNPRDFLIVVCNFTPVQRDNVKVGAPFEGQYEELLNTELSAYGGAWDYSEKFYNTSNEEVNGKSHAIEVIVPPLSVLILKPKRIKGAKS